VEGGALDLFVYARPHTVVIVIGRDPNQPQPEGGLLHPNQTESNVPFWHEVQFSMWSRPPPEGLGLHVFPVPCGPNGYELDVVQIKRVLERGLAKIDEEKFVRSFAGNVTDPTSIMSAAFSYCLSHQPCSSSDSDSLASRILSRPPPAPPPPSIITDHPDPSILPGGHASPSDIPYLIHAPLPYQSSASYHLTSAPPICSHPPSRLHQARVLMEPVVSCFAFRGHHVGLLLPPVPLTELAESVADNALQVRAKRAQKSREPAAQTKPSLYARSLADGQGVRRVDHRVRVRRVPPRPHHVPRVGGLRRPSRRAV
jgi:hypothetical protein